MSLPVTRPVGRALVVGSPSSRSQPLATLQRLGYTCVESDDPYTAMLELCRRPMVYRALILSLVSLHKEELSIVEAVKRRLPHTEVWLTQTDGRQGSLAEAMRLGADGLLGEDGLHRIAVATAPNSAAEPETHGDGASIESRATFEMESQSSEPVLTADELRALLQEQPTLGTEE